MFEIGDVVKLKSGGIPMTILQLMHDNTSATCLWHDYNGNPQKYAYSVSVLQRVNITNYTIEELVKGCRELVKGNRESAKINHEANPDPTNRYYAGYIHACDDIMVDINQLL